MGDGRSRTLHEIRADAGRHFVAVGIHMPANGARCGETRHFLPGVFEDVDSHCYIHRAFDGRTADLAIPLCRVGITDRQQTAVNFDRQVKRRANRQVLDVQISTDTARRNDRMNTPGRWRQADRPGEWPKRNPSMCAESRRGACFCVVVPKQQFRLGELVRQQSETRDDSCPAEAAGPER